MRLGPRPGCILMPSSSASTISSRAAGISSRRSRQTRLTSRAPMRSAESEMSTISLVATAETFSPEGSKSSTPPACCLTTSRAADRALSHIHGNVAAADHDHFLADGELVTQVHVEQKIDSFVDAVQIDSGNGEIAAAMSAHRKQHSIELAPQI